jgi:hypothetical protein
MLIRIVAIGLFLFAPSVEAEAVLCEEACILPQAKSCTELIEQNYFQGDCCSLTDDPETGNCIVTVSNGSCGWRSRDWECGEICLPDYTLYVSALSTDTNNPQCPESIYKDLPGFENYDNTQAPSDAPSAAPSANSAASAAPTLDTSSAESLMKRGYLWFFVQIFMSITLFLFHL